jgi:hypothetical protein
MLFKSVFDFKKHQIDVFLVLSNGFDVLMSKILKKF